MTGKRKGRIGIANLAKLGGPTDEEVEEEKINVCAVCGVEAEKRCGNCRLVHYCSPEHQRNDWKEHRMVCCPFKVKHSEELGRYLIASRDLPERSLVIKEAPFAFAPYDQTSTTTGSDLPLCLGCCCKMSDDPDRRCSSCHWPVCSRECEALSIHSNYECRLFRERKLGFPPAQKGATYSSILILRLLLRRDKSPSLWSDFLCMEHHSASRQEKERCLKDELLILENLRQYFRRRGGDGDEEEEEDSSSELRINETELREIIGRVSVNSFGVSRREEGKNDETVGRGVYLKTGIVAHGCIPNAVWGISYSPHFEIIVRTAVGIKKGEIITPTYSDIWNSLGTYPRLCTMLERSHFICKCRRCSDPTELGTFLSGVKCPKCPPGGARGYLLPLQPTDLSPEARWQCNDCGGGEAQEVIVALVENLEYEVEELSKRSRDVVGISIGMLEGHYEKLKGLLHKNHYVVRSLERELITRLYSRLGEASFEELRSFVGHCENILRVSDVLTPGYTGHGGILRNYLCDGLVQLKVKAVREGCISAIFKTTQAFQEHLRRIEELKQEAVTHLENDPDSTPSPARRAKKQGSQK